MKWSKEDAMKAEFHNTIYAGVLGKLLGVYRGRPVEGWSFEKINERFGEVYSYKSHLTGAPLIVPDDDISGTFAFCRALEDHGYKADLSAKEIGDPWLNYLVENQTILWWGGMGRSTEHTAYLRLKSGIDAPASGSIQLNGACIAEQVGGQIFIDAWALMNPGNPERAAKLARAAASVSHDGIAVECAVFLAAMEALAFVEKDIDVLLDRGQDYIQDNVSGRQLKKLRQHRTIWQEHSAKDFASYESYKRAGILYVFPYVDEPFSRGKRNQGTGGVELSWMYPKQRTGGCCSLE